MLTVSIGCGGSDSASPSSPTPVPPSTTAASSTTFQGTLAGRNGQTGTVNVTVQATVSPASLRTLAVAQATGSVRPAGGSTVSLAGNFDDTLRTVNLSGGGYAFAGRVGTDGGLAGTFTGPNNASGGFSSLNATSGAVTVYCGSAADSDGPIVLTLQISSNGALSGMVFGEPTCALTGRVAGASVSITDCDGRLATGTIQSGTISGKTPSGDSFSASTNACQ